MVIGIRAPTIAAFPEKGTPYTECFYAALRRRGVKIVEGDFSVRWLLKNVGKIDYFHFHWPSFAYAYHGDAKKTFRNLVRFVVFLMIIKLGGKKIIWTVHNLYPHRRIFLLDTLVRHFMIYITSFIFVHGPSSREIVTREFPKAMKKILVIDHGHFVSFYGKRITREVARKTLGIAAETYLYLFIGICKEYKNLIRLIECFKEVQGNVMLAISGKFQDRDYFERVSHAIEGMRNIRLDARHIPDDEMPHYVCACNVVVLPYTDILTSGAAMLAISFGKPVIAPRKGYLVDVITNQSGILYDPDDPEGLLMAMRETQKKNFDEENIFEHARSYDWDHAAEKVLEKLCV